MTDNILRLLFILALGVMFANVANYTNHITFNTDEYKIISSNIIVGAIGLIAGLSLLNEYKLQGFNQFLVQSIMTGSAYLLIINGGYATYTASREAQIIMMGIILAALLYGSTFL